MPELPETETIARDLNALVTGARVADLIVRKPDVLRETTPSALGDAVRGRSIERVWRRAKLIVLDLSSWHIVVQPRFTGGLLVDDGRLTANDLAYVAVTFTLEDARAIHYRDVRRLGTVALMSDARFAEYSSALGAEPLDPSFGAADFSVILRSSSLSVKQLLMDQRRLAGIGNIYANESLWRAGIDPSRVARSLSVAAATRLLDELRSTLRASIDARGTSFRDYRDARGERGAFVEQLAVYGRAGAACVRCGARLIGTHAIDGRSTVFCARCQT